MPAGGAAGGPGEDHRAQPEEGEPGGHHQHEDRPREVSPPYI